MIQIRTDWRQHGRDIRRHSKIYRELTLKNPDTYLPALALTLNGLAGLDQDQNQPDTAQKGYEEALKIYRELALKNPDTYLPT